MSETNKMWCERCGGNGVVYVKCEKCDGEGHTVIKAKDKSTLDVYAACKECEGDGSLESKCPVC